MRGALTKARSAGPLVVIELDMRFGSVEIRLPDGASASIDDVEVYVGSAGDKRKDTPGEGRPHLVLTGRVVCGSVVIRGRRRSLLRRRGIRLGGLPVTSVPARSHQPLCRATRTAAGRD